MGKGVQGSPIFYSIHVEMRRALAKRVPRFSFDGRLLLLLLSVSLLCK